MLVVGSTAFSVPLNSANLPTESAIAQNQTAERIPEIAATTGSPNSKGANDGQTSRDSTSAELNRKRREQLFGDDAKANGTNSGEKVVTSGEQPSDQPITEAQNSATETQQQRQQELKDLAVVRSLAANDRRVKAHEQAHASVGGVYAGAPSFSYTTGPNGVRYAVAGSVSIDTSGVTGNPQATLRKAEQVSRAALAPADPSSTDRRIASSAQALASKARFEIARLAAVRIESARSEQQAKINGEEIETSKSFESSTSFSGGQLHASLATGATDQVGGQISASA